MKDKLIKLLQQADKKCNDTKQCENCVGWGHGEECVNHLIADYLLKNGVIVPPCKVGDTVYVVSQGAGFSVVWNVYKATAKAIHLDRYGKLFVYTETEKENIGGYVEVE